MKKFVVLMKHNSGADPQVAVCDTRHEAAKVAHDFFLRYGFELRDGKPFDEGNFDGVSGGYDCFDDVVIEEHDGVPFVVGFTHADGDGPILDIKKSV